MVRSIKLSRSEQLRLYRKRYKFSKAKLAKQLKVSLREYELMEKGYPILEFISIPSVAPISSTEYLFIFRIRENLSQTELAKLVGCSRNQIVRMENGTRTPELLRKYWDARHSDN